MSWFRRHCAVPGCQTTAGRAACQDCGKPFCADHASAVEFDGYRGTDPRRTTWTRFVCAGCAARATKALYRGAPDGDGYRPILDRDGYWRVP